MPSTAVIIQQRLRNTRLPCKGRLILPTGRSVTEEVLRRCKQIVGADITILAVPEGADDDIWAVEAQRTGTAFFRGPELNVLKRYRLAADHFDVSVVLRVTADCPLLSAPQCDAVLSKVLSGQHDFAANSGPGSFSLGWSCEAFTVDLLRQADNTSTDPLAREHVGPGVRSLAKSPAYITIPEVGSDLRPSLDTKDDYLAVIWAIQHQMRVAA